MNKSRDDAEHAMKKVYDDWYNRVSEAYDLIRDDSLTDDDIIRCGAILSQLKNDLMGE